MKLLLPSMLVLLMLCVCCTNIAVSAECEKILLSGNFEYQPISWQDKKHPEKMMGVSVELVELAFKELNIPVEAKYMGTWKRTLAEASAGYVDILAGPYLNKEREMSLYYIKPPFLMDPTVIFVKKGHPIPFAKKEDLIGLVGGSPIGNSYGDDFDAFAKSKLTIEEVPTIENAFAKLLAGRNEYVVYGLYAGLAAAEKAGIRDEIEYMPHPLVSEGLYIAISKASPCMKYKDHLEQSLRNMEKAGVPAKLLEKYLKIWKEQTVSR